MIAGDLSGPVKKLNVTGTTAVMDEALFEVKNRLGLTVFAVYNEGVRVYVSDGAKGLKGGFAVGGFGTDKAESQKYLVVSKDSVRIYLDTNPLTKKLKGGFAVGGYDMTKAGNTNFLNIAADETEIISPSQNRIVWYPLKNAFLTGRVLITNSANVGTNSFASGYEPRAKGNYSQAMGYKAIADGANSTAIGSNAYATGANSFALGDSPVASNTDSYAFGAGAIASGTGSYAFGSVDRDIGGTTTGVKTTASGPYSFALGQGCTASNYISLAIGSLTTSSGRGSSAIGWYSIAQGEFATSFGPLTRSYGGASLTIGLGDVANSDYSTAIGTYSTATGYGSTALGLFASTNADYSTALGYHPYATGIYSVALGNYTTASGESSTSMGMGTTASGSWSTAMGSSTTAPSGYETVIGRFNTAYTPVYTQDWWPTDRLFVIGNGTSSSALSNAMTVYKNGVTEFSDHLNINTGSSGPALYINTKEAIWYEGGVFSWGFGGTYNVFDKKVSVGTTANPGTNSLYVAGTAWCTSGAWSGSDIRWKKNITGLDDNLNKIIQLKGIRYDWKKDEFPDQGFETGTQIGLIAQEVEKIFPELVRTDGMVIKLSLTKSFQLCCLRE
jgi:hypothetical protein